MVDLIKLGGATVIDRAKGKPDALHMITPINIVSDMIDLLDSSLWTKDTKFLDIACKSGNFLRELYSRLMKHERLIAEFPDDVYRSEWILSHQLYGIAFSELDAIIATRNVYGVVLCASNIKCMSNYIDLVKSKELYHRRRAIEIVKETFGVMKFDVIVGNPPYNNDLYIDFVLMSKQLVCGQGNICMITPAKWQAKGGEKNEQFRREIVPYMTDIVYYKDSTDVFDIEEWGGICYYTTCSSITDVKMVSSVCSKNSAFQFDAQEHDEVIPVLYDRDILHIVSKVGQLGNDFNDSEYVKDADHGEKSMMDHLGTWFKQSLYVKNTDYGDAYNENTAIPNNCVAVMQGDYICGIKKKDKLNTKFNIDKYKCICSVMPGAVSAFDKSGKVLGMFKISIIEPDQVPKGSFPVLWYFDTKEECESYVSFMECRLCAFLYYLGCCGTTLTREFFRFIPCPEKFDHIFTDDELYKKYNLTQDEIKLIESVIKERK